MPLEEIFRQAGTAKILQYLYRKTNDGTENGIIVSNILYECDICCKTGYKALDLLDKWNIIYSEKVNGFPPKRYYALTNFGAEIAKDIISIDSKLQGIDKKSNIL